MPWVEPLITVDVTDKFDIYQATRPKPKVEQSVQAAQVVPCATLEEKQDLLKKVAAWKKQQRELAMAKARKARKKTIGFQLDAYENQPKRRRA
jgi:hypothetical protein